MGCHDHIRSRSHALASFSCSSHTVHLYGHGCTEKTRSVCRIWEDCQHGHTLFLGYQLTINSTTTPCQWNDSRLPLNSEIRPKNTGRTLYANLWAWFFTLHTHTYNSRQSWHFQCKTQQPNTTSTQLPTFVLSKSTWFVCVWGGGLGGEEIFLVLLLQVVINELSLVSSDLVPNLKGAWQVKGQHGQPWDRCSWPVVLTIHLGCTQPLSLQDKLALLIKLTAHIKTETHTIFWLIIWDGWFLGMHAFKWFSALWH